MKIKDLFERDIHRPINGVVKADQLDKSSVWQELDEFVVTRELNAHISDLVGVLLSTMESEANAVDKNGIWVSGFFGCGKSHFIKVLSYLLENQEHEFNGERRHAVEFFADKIGDALLFADLKKIVAATTDTILFNIDSKADHRTGRDALLQVFLKVLNEKQGYSGDHPHIAHLERYLDEKGRLADFHAAFESASGEPWIQERDAWEFHRDEVVEALHKTLGQSEESLQKWVDNSADYFSLTVENFAKWVKQYLDGKGPDQRIMFLVDEVGQFIGNDTHLMLNLQTITEQLGTICHGRAWVVVTSQEDLDAVLGDLKHDKQYDFSKIQGRFKTRLSLSSGNVDEVIQQRLLAKNEQAAEPLVAAYEGKHDILRNQLSFVNAGMSFQKFADNTHFAACYPFPAYQFELVQKVFESIRKAGATGLHLSHGERSTLDAFQGAVKAIGDKEIGALVPFYSFYPAVEGFLDTAVKRTIDHAADNHALEPFDATVLKVLFLIRYIDELSGSVDNLVTLCINEIDTDKLALRKTVEASLARLESETLIARNGDLYFFLTNEERDIGREIKNTSVSPGSDERELGNLIFKEILGDIRKHTYRLTGRDFGFARICDDHLVGSKIEGELEVAFVTPLGDAYGDFSKDERCVMYTAHEQGRVLIRLPDNPELGRELRIYSQTNAYVTSKSTDLAPETTKRIIRDRVDENRDRRKRLIIIVRSMLADAAYFASGTRLDISVSDPKDALGDALEYLIENAYPKMSYIEYLHPNPPQEIQSTLRANDVEQVAMALNNTVEANKKALDDMREYFRLAAQASQQVVLSDLIEKRYGHRPYGWPELEVVLLVARLAVLKEIDLIVNAAPLALDDAYEHLTKTSKQRKVIIRNRETADAGLINKAQALARELFAQAGPSGEDALFHFLMKKLVKWNSDLSGYLPLAQTGKYPGKSDIEASLAGLRKFVEESQSLRFLKWFVENEGELSEIAEDYADLQGFYVNQKHSWEKLADAVSELSQNQMEIEAHSEAGPVFREMQAILQNPRPYGQLHKASDLIHIAERINAQLILDARGPALLQIRKLLDGVKAELDKVSADEALRARATEPFVQLIQAANTTKSLAHIAQATRNADTAYDRAFGAIERAHNQQAQEMVVDADIVVEAALKVQVKKRRVITPKSLCSGAFIETSEEMETFLKKLRGDLEAALAAGERVQIK